MIESCPGDDHTKLHVQHHEGGHAGNRSTMYHYNGIMLLRGGGKRQGEGEEGVLTEV